MLRRLSLPIFAAIIACGGFSATAPTASALDCWTPTVCDAGYMKPICRARYYNWNRNYAYTDYGCPTAPCRPADRSVANQLGLGRSQLAHLAHRPPVPAQLPRQRPIRRPVPPDPLSGRATPSSSASTPSAPLVALALNCD